jgi:hypothetical protein
MHHFGWEAAPDQRRPFIHLVFAGASLRLARHAGMGLVDDIAIAAAEAYSASSRVWIRRSRRQGKTKRVIGAASEGAAQQSAPTQNAFPSPEMGPSNGPKSSSSRRLPEAAVNASVVVFE